MKKDHGIAIVIIFGIIALVIFAGMKNKQQAGPNTKINSNQTGNETVEEADLKDLQKQIDEAKIQTEDLRKQIQGEEIRKTESEYKGKVLLSQVSRNTDPSKEYITIKVNSKIIERINLTGWTLKSLSTQTSVTIGGGTPLFFSSVPNGEENIYVTGGEIIYVISGISPNGISFKTNKCSGYLQQFQKYTPTISSNCPAPRYENLSEIPDLTINDACFSYIKSFPSCKVQTKNLPINWSVECKNFITTKINYNSCINVHKNDKDFYKKEWRVYLKRSGHVWKSKDEELVLYDNLGKFVSRLKY